MRTWIISLSLSEQIFIYFTVPHKFSRNQLKFYASTSAKKSHENVFRSEANRLNHETECISDEFLFYVEGEHWKVGACTGRYHASFGKCENDSTWCKTCFIIQWKGNFLKDVLFSCLFRPFRSFSSQIGNFNLIIMQSELQFIIKDK